MKQIEIDGVRYGPEEILDHSETLIAVRDHALGQGFMNIALQLSVTIALLHALAEEFDK